MFYSSGRFVKDYNSLISNRKCNRIDMDENVFNTFKIPKKLCLCSSGESGPHAQHEIPDHWGSGSMALSISRTISSRT